MEANDELGDSIREEVWAHFIAAETTNHRKFLKGDSSATSEYIYENQKKDSQKIITEFKNGKRVVSVQKRTKVGADGLMICIAVDMGMENGDLFTEPENVRILTGMSNCEWERGMIEKCPMCYKDKIFHHGQLPKANLKNLKNALIIIDEIDSGNKEDQILHQTLKDSGILDVKFMTENNIHFVFISATITRELHELYRWGNLHGSISMSIPSSYIGHGDFLKMGIIQESYPMKKREHVEKWIDEDILTYGNDFRVHIARIPDTSANTNINIIQDACIFKNIIFIRHDASERLGASELQKYFEEPLTNHIVIGVKGFYRRANLIPNKWKLRIGATHESYVKIRDNNVQIQGLPGRMTGYWREIVESGHKTGPYRTSIDAVIEYENAYLDPLGKNPYQTFGFKKNSRGKITQTTITFLNPVHIENLDPIDLPEIEKLWETAKPFTDYETAYIWWEDNLDYKITKCTLHGKNPNYYIKWETEKLPIVSLKDTISRLNLGWCSNAARIVPFQEETIQYLIVYRKDKLKKKII